MDTDTALTAVAARQHGLVADRQARSLGLSREAWRHRVAGPGWERLGPRVVRRTGTPPSEAQRALAAVLDAGPDSYLSHQSAAALWGVPGFRLAPLQVMSLRRRQTPSSLATLHFPRHLPDPFAAELDGVPVVRPALVLLQLAAHVHPERLRRMLDGLWSRRLLSGPSVRAELAPLMHRGRAGTAALRALLDSLPEGYVPPASNLEGRVRTILAEAGIPPMRPQVDLGDQERWRGRVDFLAVDLPVVLEVDGDRFHSALSDRRADEERQQGLERAGFLVERVSEFEVWHRRHVVVERVRAARRRARSRRAAA